ncbi:family 16 glycoside hydrolase [Chryseolinea lacunae]|uniref:DUF1080 domain-containing protein n=1 Tax=Chryseolinea lacunae TaxID=2801331 RepID=A0ABS1KUN1_9BACT|nr:family 16 glycoside hydrolase [Chryseolinea lacunae]MBL0743160.1 DUF1080 domain-containing protein [Chryseolinea lacunae]
MKIHITRIVIVVLLALSGAAHGQSKNTKPQTYTLVKASLTPYESDGRQGVELVAADQRGGVAWLDGKTFSNGAIEFDVMGANKPGSSFVGIAFHAQNDSTYDGIYFRPFNFVAEKQLNRDHMVQYISMPQYDWSRLREERTGQFEKEIKPAPDPDKWFHARVEVTDDEVRVFVNRATTPALTVKKLNSNHSGKIGLWVGSNSFGRFANVSF